MLVVIFAVAAFSIFIFNLNPFPQGTTTSTQTSQTTCSSTGCVRKLPIRFTFNNLYTNQPITNSLTATVYKGTVQQDSTTTSTGVWDTAKADFQSGDAYSMYVTSGNSKYEFNFQVPLAQNMTQQRYLLTLKMALIGAYSITILGPDGTTPIIPSTGTYNVTASGTPNPTFTIIITNNADNTGFTGTSQRTEIVQNGQPRKLTANAIVVTETGKARVVGQTGTSYVQTLPDHATDRTRNPDGTLNQQGRYSTTLTFDTTTMSKGSSSTITIIYYAYLDTAYFNANGVPNSEAIILSTFTFSIYS